MTDGNKRLFFGVSKEEMQRRAQKEQELAAAAEEKRRADEEAAEKKRVAEQQAAEQAKFNKDVRALYSKFGNKAEFLRDKLNVRALTLWRFVKPQMIFLVVMQSLWTMGFLTGGEIEISEGRAPGHEGYNIFAPAVSKTDMQAGDRVYEETDSPASAIGRAAVNPLLETYNFSNIFKKDAYTQLKNYDLRIIRAYFGLIVVILSAISAIKRDKENMNELNKEISKVQQDKLRDIEKLLKLWRKKDVEHISLQDFAYVEMVKKIISHMSSKDASVFHQILEGNQNVSTDVAVSIMEGHLKLHRKDVRLVLDTFDEESMPADFLAYCNSIVK